MPWQYAGSSISGVTYGADIVRHDDGRHGVALRLSWGFGGKVQPTPTRDEAVQLADAFCHVCHAWWACQERERVLAAGYAIIG